MGCDWIGIDIIVARMFYNKIRCTNLWGCAAEVHDRLCCHHYREFDEHLQCKENVWIILFAVKKAKTIEL